MNFGRSYKYIRKFQFYKTCTSIAFLKAVVFLMFLIMAGCSLPRNPVPLDKMSEAQVVGIPGIRSLEIDYSPSFDHNSFKTSDCSFLALSGGGANGAFGAGVLCGWTEAGTRPNFRIVTGISTGALIAPLAFLGPDYDNELRESYTTIKTEDILDIRKIPRIFSLLFKESFAKTEPLKNMISELVNEENLKAIANEYAKGRRLYIGTTNLDAERFVVWNMGAIAASNSPNAIKLFREVILASASIPGAFPPVYINVEAEGKIYDEMHVDGGVAAQVFGYGSLFRDLDANDPLLSEICSIYVLRNGKVSAKPKQVARKTFKIMKRSLSALMLSQLWSNLYRIYNSAENDNVEFYITNIPNEYISSSQEMFDPVEMNRLFDLGYKMSVSGKCWRKTLYVESN